MKHYRWLLLPFALLYGLAIAFRNFCYDFKIFKSYEIPVKSIVVGNLSVGGTGKSPLVNYLIQFYLNSNQSIATLSRGYGRKTKGVLTAELNSKAQEIGDEPSQYNTRFGDSISIVVAEERKLGVYAILNSNPEIDIILLDDAFQHRAVLAGLNIIVTQFERPYSSDFLLPVGRLREWRSGAKRADIIIVSKCPKSATQKQKNQLKKQLARRNQKVFFSSIHYGELIATHPNGESDGRNVLLVTGIGNPTPLVEQMQQQYKVTHLKFADHHDFTASDIESIHQKFNTFASHDKIIVTTEKDFMRLREFDTVTNGDFPWYYQPIEVNFDNEEEFNNLLKEYVTEN